MKRIFTLLIAIVTFGIGAKADNVFDETVPATVTIIVYDTANLGVITIDGVEQNTAVYNFADEPVIVLTATPKDPAQYSFQRWLINTDSGGWNDVEDSESETYIPIYADGSGLTATDQGFKDTLEIYVSFRDLTLCGTQFELLRFTAPDWDTQHDDGNGLWGTSAMTQVMTEENPTFNYTVAGRKDDSSWPWTQATAYFGMDSIYNEDSTVITHYVGFPGVAAIEITYKSEHDLIVKIPSKTILNEAGSAHQKLIPATDELTTITIYMDEFIVAIWDNDPTHRSIKLEDDSIEGVLFTPEISTLDIQAGVSGQFVVSHIGVCGLGIAGVKENTYKNLNSIQLGGIHNNKMYIMADEAGTYNVDLFSVDGKMIQHSNNKLNTGYNFINVDQPLNSGIYFIRVYNQQGSISGKTAIVK